MSLLLIAGNWEGTAWSGLQWQSIGSSCKGTAWSGLQWQSIGSSCEGYRTCEDREMEHKQARIDIQTDRQTQTDGRTNRWTEGRTDKWMDG